MIQNSKKDSESIANYKKQSLDQTFRDAVSTISKEGNRNYVNPQKPVGKLYNLRSYFSYFYLILFFTLPFIKVEGEPLFLFNVLERKFIFFGKIFWPQDFFIFGLTMITFIVFIILFTAAFGRLFCGWVCPQTIFMEMFFRKLEYMIEGDAAQQKHAEVIEVKPSTETVMEKARSIRDQAYVALNHAKWAAASAWCKNQGMRLRVVTENEIFHNGKPR